MAICGPGSIEAHQPIEHISLEQVEADTTFRRRMIDRLSSWPTLASTAG